tara:strand:- start:1279 stop:1437 length:159 start_codon:yes stop_codon:yes gene_type:complete
MRLRQAKEKEHRNKRLRPVRERVEKERRMNEIVGKNNRYQWRKEYMLTRKRQ